MIPVVAPPADEPREEAVVAQGRGRVLSTPDFARARDTAPASGLRNAYDLLRNPRPTWRESMIGGTFLFGGGVLLLSTATAVAAALRRRRRPR
jgi:hypothetical protein